MGVDENFAAIRKGLLEFLMLKIVAAEKVYAADILKHLSATDFATQEGTLYPLLRRLESQGLLVSEWREEGKRNKRFYRLSDNGARMLNQLLDEWRRIDNSLNGILSEPRHALARAISERR